MEQEVIVEVSQSVPHVLRHWTLLILWTMLKVSQQKNLKEQSETARLLHLVSCTHAQSKLSKLSHLNFLFVSYS